MNAYIVYSPYHLEPDTTPGSLRALLEPSDDLLFFEEPGSESSAGCRYLTGYIRIVGKETDWQHPADNAHIMTHPDASVLIKPYHMDTLLDRMANGPPGERTIQEFNDYRKLAAPAAAYLKALVDEVAARH